MVRELIKNEYDDSSDYSDNVKPKANQKVKPVIPKVTHAIQASNAQVKKTTILIMLINLKPKTLLMKRSDC